MNATRTHLLISVLEASKATGFPIRKWIQWVLRGLIPSEPELNADHIKGIPYESIAPSIFIPITALPKYYREAYLKKALIADSHFTILKLKYRKAMRILQTPNYIAAVLPT